MSGVDPATLLFFDASCLIAAALTIRADFILTLDQPLAGEIERASSQIVVRSPGAFIRLDLVTHPRFDRLRD